MPLFRVTITDSDGQVFVDDRWTRFEGGGEAGRYCKPPRTTFANKLFVGNLSLHGPVEDGRQYLQQWIADTFERKGRKPLRDISITLLNPDGSDGRTINYLECFLTSYSLSPLDGEAADVEAQETIEIVVGQSDNLLP